MSKALSAHPSQPNHSLAAEAQSAGSHTVHSRASRIVFLIDADEGNRVTHETILRAEGYEIVSSASGARALPLLRDEPPGLVLMSSKIGPLGAVRLTRVIRDDAALESVKILAYGSSGEFESDVLRAGAHIFVPVPVRPEVLVREVVQLIGRP